MQKISIDLLPNENSVLQVNIVVYKITGFPAYIARSHSSLVDGRLADQVVLGSKPKHAIFFSSFFKQKGYDKISIQGPIAFIDFL